MVDDEELVHQKVDERAAVGVGPVALESLCDLELGLLSDEHLGVDVLDRGLGVLERDDELLVGEDVALGRRQPVEQVVLEGLVRGRVRGRVRVKGEG